MEKKRLKMILSGREVAKNQTEVIKKEIEQIKKTSRPPKLVFLQTGHNGDSDVFKRSAEKKFDYVGIEYVTEYFDEKKAEKFFDVLEKYNSDKDTDAILPLRPLKYNIDEEILKRRINPEKDVDSVSYVNSAKIPFDKAFAPCVADAVIEILKFYRNELFSKTDDTYLEGKKIVVIGRSSAVGYPVSMLLLRNDATVTITHTASIEISQICKQSDIIVSAAGKAFLIDKDFVENHSIVIDAGFSPDKDGNLKGDCNYEEIKDIVKAITPVPGGVGSVTTTVLAKHVLKSYKNLRK